MKILIIEDEIISAEDLADIIVKIDPSFTIAALIYSVKEAIQYLSVHKDIELIFSDIELGDGLSFEIFKSVSVNIPIIFCTAYDQYAIEAFKTNGIDYILKPFDTQSIVNAIHKYRQFKKYFSPIDYTKLLEQLTGNQPGVSNSILVYQKEKILPIRLDDIALFYIERETTHLLCFNKTTYTITQTLDELEKTGKGRFFRTNRQYLVNRSAVTDAAAYFHRKYIVNLSVSFPEKIMVSKNRVTDFLTWLTLI
jgi:DNA-binding LytR/AlgR family response regulator